MTNREIGILMLVGVVAIAVIVMAIGMLCDFIGDHKRKRKITIKAKLDPEGFAPHDKVLIIGGEEKGRTAWVTEAGAFSYKGTVYVSVVFMDNKLGRTDFDEHGLVEKEYCWNVTRKGGYVDETDEGKLS